MAEHVMNHQNQLCKEINDFKNVMTKLSYIQDQFFNLRNSLNENETNWRSLHYQPDPKQIKNAVFPDLPQEIAIVVTGKTNAGKSTIVNELFRYIDPQMGSLRLPAEEIPTTARITRLIYSEEAFCRLIDENNKVVEDSTSTGENLNFLHCKLNENERYDKEKVSLIVEIGLPHKLLESGVIFYDLPGLDENDTINLTVKNFLKNVRSSFVLYVFDGVEGLQGSDNKALIELQGIFQNTSEHPNILFLVNKLDYKVGEGLIDISSDCDSEDDIDYRSDDCDSNSEKKREKAIDLLLKHEKITPPEVIVEQTVCKLKKWELLSKCNAQMVFPLSGKVIAKYHKAERIHQDENRFIDNFKEIVEKLAFLIKNESKVWFQSVTTGILEILVPWYKSKSVVVGKQFVDCKNTERIEKTLLHQLEQLYEDLKRQIFEFEWRAAMETYNVKITKHIKEYTHKYTKLLIQLRTLSSDRNCLINLLKNDGNKEIQTLRKDMFYFLCDLCDNICYLIHRKFSSLLKNIRCRNTNFPECRNFHASTFLDKHSFKKCNFETLYIDYFCSTLNKKNIYKETSNKVLKYFLSCKENKDSIEILLRNSDPFEKKINLLCEHFCEHMMSTQWNILLGEHQILGSYLKDAEKYLDASHNAWKVIIDELVETTNSGMKENLQPLQTSRHRISNLLMMIYAVEYQYKDGLNLEDIRKNMTPFHSDGRKLDTNLFIFQPDQSPNPSELQRIDLSDVEDSNRKHRICSHILKSRWIRELRHGDTEKADKTHEDFQYLRMVRWWLYDASTSELFVASQIESNNLATVLVEKSPSLRQRLNFGCHILQAIILLHKNQMCHGDIRPEIINISHDGTKALLNLSKIPDPMKKIKLYDDTEYPAFHLALDRYENLREHLNLTHHDVFAFGSLLWLLVEGSGKEVPSLYKNVDFEEMKFLLKKNRWPEKPKPCNEKIDKQIGNKLYEAMQSCWRASHETDTIFVLRDVHHCLLSAIKVM